MSTLKSQLSLAAAGLMLFAGFSACKEKKDHPTTRPPVRVEILKVSESANQGGMEYSGTVVSSETTSVSFSIAGTITSLTASEGQKVSKGQLLGKVRDGEYVNALNIAKAQLDEAQDGYNRLKKLHDANALPDVKWVEMQQKLKQAQTAVEMAQRSVDDATLYSPVNGTVTKKLADVGQTVVPVQPIYEIVSTSDLTVDISVSENAISNFVVGEKAIVEFDNGNLEKTEGKVSQKSVVADPLTRAYTVKVAIPNMQGKVLPGMIAKVRFDSSVSDSIINKAIVVPSQAVLLNEDNRLFVWIVKNNEAERRFVTADELVTNGVMVKTGLEAGDSVIIAGMQKVGSGTKVIAITK